MGSCDVTLFLCVFMCCLPKTLANACEKSCNEPLGMESKRIKDYQITASSCFNDDCAKYGPQRGRLNLASWPPGYRANPAELQSTWRGIEVDLGSEKVITGLATQGYGDTSVTEWVTSYTVLYKSTMGDIMQLTTMHGYSKDFRGNKDSNSIRYHDIPIPIVTSTIIFLPQTWIGNVGFRFELYGCDPGYYFVVWRMFDGRFFTPNHATVNSDDYKVTREEAVEEIERYLRLFPGFLSVEFITLSPHKAADFGYTVLAAEMKILCLKSSENNLALKLNMEITYRDVVFQFPLRCQCSYPRVNISLKKTLEEATVLYTTQNMTVDAEVKHGNCYKSLFFEWEITKASDQSSQFGSFVAHGEVFNNKTEKLELEGRELEEGYLFIRCIAFVKTQSGNFEVKAYDYGYVRVLYPPLIVQIAGSITAIKGNGSVALDASSSYDPQTPVNNSSGLTFSWYCQRIDDNIPKQSPSGCYGHHAGKLSSRGPMIVVDIDRMDANNTYLFELVVTKDYRISRAFHTLYVNPPYVITLRCAINCGRKISTNRRMIIKATCKGTYCLEDNSYSWTLYKFALSANSSSWLEVQNLQSYLLTNVDSPNIVFSGSRKPLEQRTKYKIVASVLLRDEIVERGEMVFITNSPPHNRYGALGCDVYPKKGRVLQTKYNVTCFGWDDEDLPLSYQLRYHSPEGLVIISSGNTSSFITMLPQGNQSEHYEVKLEVQIFDSLCDASTVEVTVKVESLRKAEVTTTVNKSIYGPNSTTAKLLRSGNLQSATLTSYFTLTATEGTVLSVVETNAAKDEVLRQLVGARPQMLQEVTQLLVVVIKATRQRNNMKVNTVSNATSLLESMAIHFDREANVSEDIDVIQQVGGSLLNGMSHVLDVLTKNEAADTKHIEKVEKDDKRLAKFKMKSNEEKPRMIEDSVALMDKLGTALLSTKVVGESQPSIFKTYVLSMVLDRQTPSMLVRKRLQWDNGSIGVAFPSMEVLIQNFPFPVHSLDVQVITFKSNPFAWDTSSRYVTSDVMDVSLKSDGGYLHFSRLEEAFELFIPLKNQRKKETSGRFFVKRSNSFENIRYHRIVIPSHKVVAIIDIVPVENDLLKIFISAGARPTRENYSYSTYVPNFSSCKNVTTSNGYQQCSSISPYRLLVSSSLTGETGIHYVGILWNKNSSDTLRMNDTSNESDVHRRLSRSTCDTKSARKKRSCITVKDPPTTPPPTPKIIKPPYNSNADANYTMSVSISSCFYWSKEKQHWTNDGCKVGSKTNPSKLHCLCTHLSAFGGDFFVAANPIDFDKVWFEFGRLEKTGNFVTAVVFCVYGLYFVGLILTRRADKKDQDKVVANVIIGGHDQGGCIYEIQIQTGIWKGFGTTANVGINIFGEEGSSGPIILTDFSVFKKIFSRGSVTNFVISLPRSLGRLVKLCIWHDNFGESPSWFLQQAMITEAHSGNKWNFFANKWIAVERGSGNLSLELRAFDETERAGFKQLFYSTTSRNLGDEHLWVSLFTRPPHSPFTRSQRLSCCLSFLFSSMVVNAMFYQFSENPKDSFKFGPLVLSLRQIIIGIQSAFIAIPVNLLTVTIFRNVRPYFLTSNQPKTPVTIEKTSRRLPRCFVFIAWIVCLLVTLASSAFTVFYSLSWGADISNQWLTSIIVSLVEDVVFFQPVKVIFLTAILSLIIRTSPEKEYVQGATVCIEEEQEYNAPNEYLLSKAKEYGTKFLQMYRAIKNVCAFLIFVLLLMAVCYGNRDSKRFLMTTSVENIFRGFEKVADKDSFWVWTRHKLIPGLYHASWYNSRPFRYQEGFLSNREAFLIGMPRLRQIRIKQGKKCKADRDFLPLMQDIKRCLLSFPESHEDKSQYYQPKWISVQNLTTFSNNLKIYETCPKPWRYQSAETLQTLPYPGVGSEYDGGGFVADLGYNEESAFNVINKLQDNEWIDEFTAAVFIEFSVHEPSSRLFSFAKYLYERLPTGGVVTTVKVQTLVLYMPLGGPFNAFYELCQLSFVVFTLILVLLEIKKFVKQKKAFFTKFWNWVCILQILTSICAAIIGLLKAKQTSLFIKRVQENPYNNPSPDHLARLSEYEDYLLALVIFTATIRLLNLFMFNSHIGHMAATLRRSSKSLLSFAVVFGNSLLAFSFSGVLTFGDNIAAFSSFYQSFGTVVRMSVGGIFNFPEVKLNYRIIGPLFLSAFVVWMMLILVNISVAILVDFYKVEREDASDDSLARFMYTYFSTKTLKFLKSLPINVQSKAVKQRIELSRTHWKRSGQKIIALSRTVGTARSQNGVNDQDLETISPYQEFDSFRVGDYWQNVSKSDSYINCMCSNKKVFLPEKNARENVGGHLKNRSLQVIMSNANSLEKMSSTSNVILHSNDEVQFKTPDIRQLVLTLVATEFVLGLHDIDINHVKSIFIDVALELNTMLAEFKETN